MNFNWFYALQEATQLMHNTPFCDIFSFIVLVNIIYDIAVSVNQEGIHATTENRLLDQVRHRLRLKNYTYRTEKSYQYWIKQYILFHNKRHPVVVSWHKACQQASHTSLQSNSPPSQRLSRHVFAPQAQPPQCVSCYSLPIPSVRLSILRNSASAVE